MDNTVSPPQNPPSSTFSASMTMQPVSQFLCKSFSDILLDGREEQLARVAINDATCEGHSSSSSNDSSGSSGVRRRRRCGGGGLGENQRDPLAEVPYSTSSPAFVSPGVTVVSEIWTIFAREKSTLCESHIDGMNIEALRRCLLAHNQNQRGSEDVVRQRLQQFFRRLRQKTPSAAFQVQPMPTGSQGAQGESAMASLARPIVLTPDVFYDFLLIIDLEATCEENVGGGYGEFPHEIIEFPVMLYDTRQRKCVGIFHSYCRPVHQPTLSTFCTQLTQISQSQVDGAMEFPVLLYQLEMWMFAQNGLGDKRWAIVCDCASDMATFMRLQCHFSQLPVPQWATQWVNLSEEFHRFYHLPPQRKSTLARMLEDLDLGFVGQHHNGLDDATNILRVVQIMLADGCQLRVNQRLEPQRPPFYTAPIARPVADAGISMLAYRRTEPMWIADTANPTYQAPTSYRVETITDQFIFFHFFE